MKASLALFNEKLMLLLVPCPVYMLIEHRLFILFSLSTILFACVTFYYEIHINKKIYKNN